MTVKVAVGLDGSEGDLVGVIRVLACETWLLLLQAVRKMDSDTKEIIAIEHACRTIVVPAPNTTTVVMLRPLA